MYSHLVPSSHSYLGIAYLLISSLFHTLVYYLVSRSLYLFSHSCIHISFPHLFPLPFSRVILSISFFRFISSHLNPSLISSLFHPLVYSDVSSSYLFISRSLISSHFVLMRRKKSLPSIPFVFSFIAVILLNISFPCLKYTAQYLMLSWRDEESFPHSTLTPQTMYGFATLITGRD